jgi:hypothetical protein
VKIFSITLAVLGFAASLIAAYHWWRASRVDIPASTASISDVPELHILGTQVAFNESSRLNQVAAIWTGAAALLSSAASVFGVL